MHEFADGGGVVFNENGNAVNFRVESDTDVNALFVDGTNNRLGIGTASPSVKVHATIDNSGTTTVTDVLQLNHSSTGTPAASFGTGLLFTGESSTTDAQNMARIQSIWTTATHASRTSALQFQTLTNAGSLTNRVMIFGDGGVEIGTSETSPGISRLSLKGGTALVAGDIGLTGWGANASIVGLTGNDSRGRINVRVNVLDTPSANPSIRITFKDGTWSIAPFAVVNMGSNSTGPIQNVTCETQTTLMDIVYVGTPTATTQLEYIFNFIVLG
jgi:hypothetical protein